MTIEYLPPTGIACNLKCAYCYQDPMRDAGNLTTSGDWEAAKAQIDKQNYRFAVFGGEPLLTSKAHLEEVFKYGFERFGGNGIQTNGLLIDDDHIRMFRNYNVSVGLSIDGPSICNSLRSTPDQTAKILVNIVKLCNHGIVPSLIITVHRANVENVAMMTGWLDFLRLHGVRSYNFHILETESEEVRQKYSPTNTESLSFFIEMYKYFKGADCSVNPFSDITKLLTQTNPGGTSCIWNACDPLTTTAVHGIRADGELSNCGRTNKDGINWIKAEGESSKERYVALFQTPQEFGGCKDCKYFYACKGQCPGTAIDGDWRNKTIHCTFWYDLMSYIQHDLTKDGCTVLPVEQMIDKGRAVVGYNPYTPHGDVAHGDAPHGDSHGDHNDLVSKSSGVEVTWVD